MAKNKLRNILDQAFIIHQIHRAEKLGKAKETVAMIRKDLADVLNYSLERVSGTAAEGKKIRPNRILQKGLQEADVALLRAYASLAGSERQRVDLQREAAEVFFPELAPEIALPIIRHFTEGTRGALVALLSGPDAEKIRALISPKMLAEQYPPLKNLRGEMGAHTDYNTPRKRQWRKVAVYEPIRAFLPDAQSRARENVLDLPGKECLEICEVLLPLGINPRRITAVEGGDRYARAEFRINAFERDVDFHTCLLQKLLPGLKTRFGVVILDFAGQLCPTYHDIAAQLLLSERALVIFNTMARREAGDTQQELEWLWKHMLQEAQQDQRLDLALRGLRDVAPPSAQENLSWSLADARELSSLLLVTGILRTENWGLGGKITSLPLLEQVRDSSITHERVRLQENMQIVLRPLLEKLLTLLKSMNVISQDDVMERKGLWTLDRIYYDVLFGNTYITKLQKFAYESDSGAGNLVYHTDAAVIHTPLGLYQEPALKQTVEFLFNCVREVIQEMHDNPDPEILNRYRYALVRGGHFVKVGEGKRSDQILFLRDSRAFHGRMIPVHIVCKAAQKYSSYRSREATYTSLLQQLRAPRQWITE